MQKDRKPVYVTQPTLAPLDEFAKILEGPWSSGILTHNGPLVQRFEKETANALGIKNLVAVSNGTIALQMAIRALKLRGEIITSPFTWIATVSSIMWEGCTPVFADIDPETLNISTEEIRKKITPATVAIMPVHVFGNPCNVDEIEKLAAVHNLKVIYDAAHAVGTTWKGKSILEYGTVSATSFHATKILNTAEGGACVTSDNHLHEVLKSIRFFGHDDNKEVVREGLNGKMTEVHAALGLANLGMLGQILSDRKKKYQLYLSLLEKNKNLGFQKIYQEECNYSYFPVIFDTEENLIRTEKSLNKENYFPRRYFFPSVNTYSHLYNYSPAVHAEDISRRILCLPLYFNLEESDIQTICKIICNQ